MTIKDMFVRNINRDINGVVQVEQDEEDIIYQEVDEYVVTKELKKHFMTFFNNYNKAFDDPTSDIGVWISGFFGSGKSHFLKMLAYLLENKKVAGTSTVELFRAKFKDDPGTFMEIENSARHETETILFNIDVESPANKDKTAVLRVFAKMFFKHLGYYGENLKVAMLEQYIDSQGKTEEFRRVFEEKGGMPWVDIRRGFAFNGRTVISTLMDVLDMSEEDAQRWYNDKSAVEYSISDLVSDIKAYVDSKPKDFRLVFLMDEVGQYVGTDTDMLLNLQSIVEELGRVCRGKVWVICTGQEAIDEIIKVRMDEFSRIQARFKTRLSLSSSSVDEVIQERLLSKTSGAETRLQNVYEVNDAALRNLFTFKDARLDIKGFTGTENFSKNFPFVPYQFIILQKAFEEIRKKGMIGQHQSGVERSMLEAFHMAAMSIEDNNEYTLAPFYRFYDAIHETLDGSIRRVIERCQRAGDTGDGLEPEDVNLLKLLYLIRYVDDIPANLDNLVILMADDISVDKVAMREKLRGSLDRLLDQNYIGRSGEVYNFLTDEEQDVAREIKTIHVDTSSIVEHIGRMIFGDIYTTKKFRYGIYDFPFDEMVDGTVIGSMSGGMCLKILTVATDDTEKSELRLMTESKGQVIVVLPESSYYDSLEKAMMIRKFVKQRNVSQLPKTTQDIIREQQEEASKYEAEALEDLKKAIESATFYADGERLDIKSGDAKSKIDQAMEYLVVHVYSGLDLITKNAQSDADIISILRGEEPSIPGTEPNRDAAATMEEYLEVQNKKHLPTSMADVQSRYQAIPYGWREIDIAAVAAQLIFDQKVTIKYAGTTIQPDNPKLPDMLRKKSEVGKTSISKRISPPDNKMREARDFLREYFDVMDVPSDEDGLVAFIISKFTEQKTHYEELNDRYVGHKYPDQSLVKQAISLMDDVLSQQKDNIALIDRLIDKKQDLEENKDQMQRVEGFFKNQVNVFDSAVKLENDLRNELDYLAQEPDANNALNQIRVICAINTGGKVDYRRIPELNGLINTVHEGHNKLLEAKQAELMEIVRQCMESIQSAAVNETKVKDIIQTADKFYDQKKQQIKSLNSLALLDGQIPPMLQYKDATIDKIEAVEKPENSLTPKSDEVNNPATKKVYKKYNRSAIFPSKKLESEEDVDAYLGKMKETLMQLLQNCDGIDLK